MGITMFYKRIPIMTTIKKENSLDEWLNPEHKKVWEKYQKKQKKFAKYGKLSRGGKFKDKTV